MMSGMGLDTRTRYQGMYARHQTGCAIEARKRCRCRPSYYGVVWDRARPRQIKTKRMVTVDAARNARDDLAAKL